MNKKKLHHIWTKIRPFNAWYFLAAFLVSLVISVYALRQNNLHMIQLREAVAAADQNDADVETALRELREYVYNHMNTNLASGATAIKPPIQLKYRYERLVKAEQERVASANARIYSDAQAYCEQQVPASVSGAPRVTCVQDYVSSHGGASEKPIPDDIYKFDFVSPLWSPDFAGWSVLVTSLLFILFLVRLGFERWARVVLANHD